MSVCMRWVHEACIRLHVLSSAQACAPSLLRQRASNKPAAPSSQRISCSAPCGMEQHNTVLAAPPPAAHCEQGTGNDTPCYILPGPLMPTKSCGMHQQLYNCICDMYLYVTPLLPTHLLPGVHQAGGLISHALRCGAHPSAAGAAAALAPAAAAEAPGPVEVCTTGNAQASSCHSP